MTIFPPGYIKTPEFDLLLFPVRVVEFASWLIGRLRSEFRSDALPAITIGFSGIRTQDSLHADHMF